MILILLTLLLLQVLQVQPMALSVKAYLLLSPEQQEIRRFPIEGGASYDSLLARIRTAFPAIRNKPLNLFWKDQDEELVAFSSHEELLEALGSMKGDAFRVFVKVLDGQEESYESSSSQPVNQVICDGCKTGIAGDRFKCAVCPNYDLCNNCEGRGLHREHEMQRIYTPGACQWFPGSHCRRGPHHGSHGCGSWTRGCHGSSHCR